MTLRHLSYVLFVIACTGRSSPLPAHRDRLPDPSLTGAWDLTLTLERPYQLGFSNPAARRVCGTMGFVDGVAANDDRGRESQGVYHIALGQLGLDWLDDPKFPSAIARQRESNGNSSGADDSVAITLNPESQERIELRGVYRMSAIVGGWRAQSARGTASGVFTLRQHVDGSAQPEC